MRESHTMIAAHVGAKLKELRGGLTQSDYAAKLGLSQAQYNRYETGKRLAPDSLLSQAAGLAGIEPEQILFPGEVSAEQGSAGAKLDLGGSLAALIRLLDRQSQEDLYYFLKNKIQNLPRGRQRKLRQAQEEMDQAMRQAV